jgi:Tol biopolymer transport system component/predicted Ser/Thr protein kinase
MTPERFRRIEEIYHAACEHRPEEWSAFLDGACQGEPEMRQRIERMLAEADTGNGLLDRSVSALLSETGTIELKSGARLGPYQIEGLIGQGGMGKVYRARDTRLGRTVAIKTSSARFSERFEREARAVAALNHAHISHLYDVGPDYLVMEFIEGAPIKGPLSVAQALHYAEQICDALDAAHRAGIVHRDLKPGNILVSKQGIKLLDFGLAQMQPGPDDPTVVPTVGVMGTPAYMAPEQWEGKRADARSDIYAFGCVLYEMLTGKRAALNTGTVDRAAAAAPLEKIIRTCLEKDPEERWQTVRELKHALNWAGAVKPPPAVVTAPDRVQIVPAVNRRMPWLVAATAMLLAGMAVWAPWRHDLGSQIGAPLVRIDADLGTGVSLFTENGPAVALSHDGTRVAFSSRSEDGNMRLFWRRLDQVTATVLPGTESAFAPFFSPNGEQLGFFAEGSLKKVELPTGNVTVLANAINPAGGAWGEDGVIIFHRGPSLDLWTVPANGGDMKQVAREGNATGSRFWPQLLPGGKALLVTRVSGLDNMEQESVEALSLADGHSRKLVDGAHFGRYLSSGHLAYLRRGTLFVRRFDAARLTLTGPEVPILQGVEYSTVNGAGQFDIAANGTLIYRAARPGSELKTVQRMDSAGHLEPLVGTPGDYRAISFSRDGKRLAMTIGDGGASDLYVYDVERRQQPARLTVGARISRGWGPAWSPDGRYLFFSVGSSTWWVRTEGLSQPREFIKNAVVTRISRDGTRMFVGTSTPKTRGDAAIVPLSRGRDGPQAGRPVPLLHEVFTEIPFEDSLDGKWLSYSTDETGIAQTYVMEVANPARKWMVSSGSGQRAFWSPSGREIFFTTFFAPLRIMVTPYSLEGGTFHPGQPHQWSPVTIPGHASSGATSITMAPDGEHFAVLMPAEQPLGNRVTFVMNFFDEVRRKVPAGQ